MSEDRREDNRQNPAEQWGTAAQTVDDLGGLSTPKRPNPKKWPGAACLSTDFDSKCEVCRPDPAIARTAAGEAMTLLKLPAGTADHAYVPAKKLLIVPQMNENKVTAFRLRTAK